MLTGHIVNTGLTPVHMTLPGNDWTSSDALFFVTRYIYSMKKTAKQRGRHRKDNAMTAAERMRAYRKRRRDTGLKNVRGWEPVEGVRQYSDQGLVAREQHTQGRRERSRRLGSR